MKNNPFVIAIVNFFKKHDMLKFFSFYSFAMPIVPVLLYYNGEYKSLIEILIIFSPVWLLVLALCFDKKKLVTLFFAVYIIWGTVYAIDSFYGVPFLWVIYIASIIVSILSAIAIVYS